MEYRRPVSKLPSAGDFYADRGHRRAPRAGAGPQDGHDDAMGIADLLACGLIEASFVPRQDIPERRSLMPTREHPVREQTQPAQRCCISINGGCARSYAQPPAGVRRGRRGNLQPGRHVVDEIASPCSQ
jgi:hypothetical protein